MRKKDYIVLHTSDVDLAKKLTLDYFTDSYFSHDGTAVELYTHISKEQVLIKFIDPVLNELFIFFFTSIICEKELGEKSFIGWFSVSDNITFANEKGDFCLKLKDDKFRSRVVLNHVDVDYTLGYSDQSKRIEFYYDGVFKIENSAGYIDEYIDENDFNFIEKIDIEKQISKFDRPGFLKVFWERLKSKVF